MNSKCVGDQIVTWKKACIGEKHVTKNLCFCQKTIHNVIKWFEYEGISSSKPIPRRNSSVCIQRAVAVAMRRMDGNPNRNVRKFAKDRKISRTHFGRIAKEELQLKTHKMQRPHLLSAATG